MLVQEGQTFDVVIVGAGPAGSACAIRLADRGKKVLLVEKARFPRHKLCGEFVSPECIEHLEELGIASGLGELSPPELTETRFYARSGRSLAIPTDWLSKSNNHAIGISRSKLDALLLDGARKAGAAVLEHSDVESVVVENGTLTGMTIKGSGGNCFEIRADIAIDATGRSQALTRHFNSHSDAKRADLVAFKAHCENACIDQNVCEIYCFGDGYGGCSEVENGVFNVCFVASASRIRELGSDRKLIFQHSISKNARAGAVLSDVNTVSDWLTVAIPRFGRNDPVPFSGVFAIGDAAGFIDPFTGSGIALALQTSKLCVDAILSNRELNAVERQYRRSYAVSVAKRMRFCAGVRFLSKFPIIADGMIGFLARSRTFGQLTAKATRAGTFG